MLAADDKHCIRQCDVTVVSATVVSRVVWISWIIIEHSKLAAVTSTVGTHHFRCSSVRHTSLPESPLVAFNVPNDFPCIWEVGFPQQRPIPEHPHYTAGTPRPRFLSGAPIIKTHEWWCLNKAVAVNKALCQIIDQNNSRSHALSPTQFIWNHAQQCRLLPRPQNGVRSFFF